MKRGRTTILTSALVSLFCLNLTGQYHPGIYKLRYSDSGGERGTTTYVYGNNSTMPIKAIWELEDGSRWSVNTHTFDQGGNMQTKHRLFSDSIVVDQTFDYNASGQIISESFQRSDGVSGTVSYSYENDLMTDADCRGYNGWFHGKIVYKYNSGKLKDSAIIYSPEWRRLGSILYRYDNKNRLAEEKWEFVNGGWQIYSFEYLENDCVEYSSSNVYIRPSCEWVVETESYNFSGSEGGPSYYTYADGNKLISKIFERSDGLRTETRYNYHEDGLLEKSVRKYSDGSEGTFFYNYDNQRNLIERTFYRCDTLNGYEKYSYDFSGKLIEGRLFNFDSWLSGSLSFYHDMLDRVSKGEFKSDIPGINASILFLYDQNSNLTTIHWEFENGSTQTYKFKYSDTQKH